MIASARARGRGIALWIVLCAASVGLTVACAVEDVTVATRSEPDASLDCTDSHGCPAGAVCAQTTCADPHGTCAPRPPSCDDELDPVCGCDGVTYWNDCMRRRAGVASLHPHPCEDVPSCIGPHGRSCPEGSRCVALAADRGDCAFAHEGRCWTLPSPCSAPQIPWLGCDGPPICLDLCAALQTGQPMRTAAGECH